MTAAPASVPRPESRFGIGRVTVLVTGSVAVLVAVALLVAGGATLWLDRTQRDDAGFVSTPAELFESSSYAIATTSLELAGADGVDWWGVDRFGAVRVTAEGAGDAPIFVGIAATSDVDAYLAGVGHDELAEVDWRPFSPTYRPEPGAAPATAPAGQPFWVASVSGSGPQVLEWELEDGTWSLVVMNADGSRGVAAEVSAGAELGFLPWLAAALGLAGLVVLAGGVGLILVGARAPVSRTERRT